MIKILLIVGTRPNFVKLAPLFHRLRDAGRFGLTVCHTGQHFDTNMSDAFWSCLELPRPDFDLKVNGTSAVSAIGKTIVAVSKILEQNRFDLAIVFGDVNATLAGAIASVQSGIKLMHVEAGLRSFDRRMPEEINRLMTDQISDFLMVSEESGLENLRREGVDDRRIFFVGNIMIECLLKTQAKWRTIRLSSQLQDVMGEKFVLATFHRPENVDGAENRQQIIEILKGVSERYRVVFPVHPRTKRKLCENMTHSALAGNKRILQLEPLGYFEFIKLLSQATCVMTDSGGVQEEAAFLKKPCVTFRNNTERPVTILRGTNKLLSLANPHFLEEIDRHVGAIHRMDLQPIPLWDEHVSQRIVDVILKHL